MNNQNLFLFYYKINAQEKSLFFRGQSSCNFGHRGSSDGLGNERSGLDQLLEVDAGLNAHAVQHVDDVFGWNVSGGSGRIGASSKSGHAWIDDPDPEAEGRQDVAQGLAVGVVAVNSQLRCWNSADDCFQHRWESSWKINLNYIRSF